MPWIEDAYDVQFREVVRVVKEFSRLDMAQYGVGG
jgi:hypothetical protein